MADNTSSAGSFGRWIAETLDILSAGGDADVPCGGCTACCRSAQFILIEPDDPSLGSIDPELLVPAVGLPDGHLVMGYDENGHCPMLVDDTCSIYDHRPKTCRTYDCRVFPASNIWPEHGTKVEISTRAETWQFIIDETSEARLDAVRRAGVALLTRRTDLFGAHPPENTQLAAMAIVVHDLFFDDVTPPDDVLLDRLRPR